MWLVCRHRLALLACQSEKLAEADCGGTLASPPLLRVTAGVCNASGLAPAAGYGPVRASADLGAVAPK
jgi:hypothetical protein